MGLERCSPSSVGLWVLILVSKGLAFTTGHRTAIPRGLEALCSLRCSKLDLWTVQYVREALVRCRAENPFRILESDVFTPASFSSISQLTRTWCRLPCSPGLSACSSLFVLSPGDVTENDTLRRWGKQTPSGSSDMKPLRTAQRLAVRASLSL